MIVYILLAILLIMVALLFIPLHFFAQGQITEDLALEMGLAWAGGLVAARWRLPPQDKPGAEVRVGPWNKPRRSEESEEPSQSTDQDDEAGKNKRLRRRDQPPANESGRKTNRNVVRSILDRQVLAEVLALLAAIWRSLRLRCNLDGYYGTDDPASTAYIAAFITALKHCGRYPGLNLNPRFDQLTVNLTGALQGQLVPGLIILDLGRFMLKTPIRKIWWTMLRERNNR
ncbi:MAG: hypothetical protein PHG75_08730 [Syntrophomonas sp.]|nr:hypothetical protein [Syntrophomonas sp.]